MSKDDVKVIRLAVVPANKPGQLTTVDCGMAGDYPAGTQTDAYVLKGLVAAVVPAGMGVDGHPIPGCLVHLHGVQSAIRCFDTAEEVAKLLGWC